MKMMDKVSQKVISRTIRNYLHKSGFDFMVPKSIPILHRNTRRIGLFVVTNICEQYGIEEFLVMKADLNCTL